MLKAEILNIKTLFGHGISRMLDLIQLYYENIVPDKFKSDIAEKDSILLLKDENVSIEGFSTIKLLEVIINDLPVGATFSGDTVISEKCPSGT